MITSQRTYADVIAKHVRRSDVRYLDHWSHVSSGPDGERAANGECSPTAIRDS